MSSWCVLCDIKSVWQELDQQRLIKMECAKHLKTLQEEIQLDHVSAFLAGLDDVFNEIQSDILRTQPWCFILSVVKHNAKPPLWVKVVL